VTAPTSTPRDADHSATPLPAIPDWYPAWARQLASAYFAGSASVFVVHFATWLPLASIQRATPREVTSE